jgi:hypothetical protein
MKNSFRKFCRQAQIVLAALMLAQMSFASVVVPRIVQAQLVPDAINTNTTPVINVPQYGGVEQSIADYLCVPDSGNTGTALYQCIGKVYRFGIAFGAIALVFFLVFAGYMYMVGGEKGKEKGKGIFFSALTGMAIILSSYVLLNFINPNLVKIKTIQPPIFSASDLPDCKLVGLGENCILAGGQVNYGSGPGVAGSASEAAIKSYITKYALANGLEYCQLASLINKESSFITNNVSNGPPNRVDINSTAKYYGLTFTQGNPTKGHGIGLAQVFIYGPPPHKSWADSSTPSRDGKEFGFNRPLTVKDLVNPDIAVSAGAHFFAAKVGSSKGNIGDAYAKYYGDPNYKNPNTRTIVNKMLKMYEECKKR